MSKYPNPLIPGFNPDPSIVEHEGFYYLVTSTFEYLPGIPIYKSADLIDWHLIGHVVTRQGQLQRKAITTGGGAWAPTIRFHEGLFYVAVTEMGGRGTVIFTTTNPAGDWSDGLETEIEGIDPDLVWDESGTLFATFSGLILSGANMGRHLGIQQAKIDPATGKLLEEPRSIWSGTGLMFPEAPHIYKIGEWWYLMIAEGGTERGHAVSIARSKSIEGPFVGAPSNPVLSARSTDRSIQNTGHGDLARAPDGSWIMVLLGMRTRGQTRGFSTLGRETFITELRWDEEGWPVVNPVEPNDVRPAPEFNDEFSSRELSHEWISVRQLPQDTSELTEGGLKILANGESMDDERPGFVGRRVRRLDGMIKARLKVDGVGGLTMRYDEAAHYDIELAGNMLLVRSRLAKLVHEERSELFNLAEATDQEGYVTLAMRYQAPPAGFGISAQTSDLIDLGWISQVGEFQLVSTFDGRYLSAEVTCSFTGRVAGCYSTKGSTTLRAYSETGLQA